MKKIDKTQLIDSYTADSQTALSDVDHLYKRPALTFGGERSDESYPFSSQKTVAIREILDNAIGEIEVGVADRVRVTFFLDGSVEVLDNGRGMPVDNSVDAYGEEINGLYKSMGLLKSGQSLGDVKKGKFVSSLNGVGGSSTQYFSEYFKIEVYRKNRIYRLDFKDGVNGLFEDDGFKPYKNKVKLDKQMDRRDQIEKKLYPHGTRLTFKLNDERFASQYLVDVEDIKLRIKRASFLFPKATFIIRQETNDGFVEKEYYSENGLVDLVNLQLNNSITSPIVFSNKLGFRVRGKDNGKIDSKLTGEQLYRAIQKEYNDGDALGNERELIYEFAFGYNSDYSTSIDSFANSIRNTLGGVHVEAFEKALVKTFNDKFHSMNNGLPKNGPDVILRDIEEGLIAAISIKTNEPEFNGQEKQLLSSKDLQKALQKDLEDQLEKWLNKQSNRETLEIIAKKVIQAMKNRSKAQAQIELNREKNKIMKSNSLPTSLVDCEITHHPMSELYVCLKGDTKVKLLDGRDVKIADLVGEKDLWAYSTNRLGQMTPGKILKAFPTKKVNKTLKIVFSDGSIVECTPEHKFLDRLSINWVEAKDLYIGQSLFSMKFKLGTAINNNSRPMVWVPMQYTKFNSKTKVKQGHWEPIHQRVIRELGLYKKNYNIHHVDLNIFNNSPDNLVVITPKEHLAIHNRINHDNGTVDYKNKKFTPESLWRMQNGYLFASEENKEAHKLKMSKFCATGDNAQKMAIVNQSNRIIRNAKHLINLNLEINENNWNSNKRTKNTPNYNNIFKYFTSIDNLIEEANNFNLEVVNIEEVNYIDPIQMYCLTIDTDFHSFVLENGIITHNCEGLSALSGLKTVRDSRFQSLLPVKGKILNVRKASAKEILQNQEIQDIIKSLGCGIGEECVVENGRYQNIIIATDSDVDGAAISNLMITLVWELFPDYIRKGKLFRMLSPLYEIVADKSYYCLTNDEKISITNDLTNRGIKIKENRRFKGLGETGAKVLKETGIDPKTRTLLQIKLEDVQKAEEMIELISGDSSDARKNWIMENEYIPEIVEVND